MKVKKDFEIIENYMKKACSKISKYEYVIRDDLSVRDNITGYIGNEEFFFPKKIKFKKDFTYRDGKRIKLKKCCMEDEDGKTLSFFIENVEEDAFGKVAIHYTLGDKKLQFDCLTFENYDIYRYYKKIV